MLSGLVLDKLLKFICFGALARHKQLFTVLVGETGIRTSPIDVLQVLGDKVLAAVADDRLGVEDFVGSCGQVRWSPILRFLHVLVILQLLREVSH